tara:strand:- start:221 stop:1102 length:882 start_codon:yes stop_codon:yes gene_type:complete
MNRTPHQHVANPTAFGIAWRAFIIVVLFCFLGVVVGCRTATFEKKTDLEGETIDMKLKTRALASKGTFEGVQLDEHTRLGGAKVKSDGEAMLKAIVPMLQAWTGMMLGMAELRIPPPPQIIVVTQVVERAVEAPVPDPDPDDPAQPLAPGTGDWQSEETVLELPDADWMLSYDVRGLVDDPGKSNGGRDCEHMFGDIRGDGFERIMLMNMCDDGHERGLRVYFNGAEHDMADVLNGLAVVEVSRFGDRLVIKINGRTLADKSPGGTPERFWVGGGNESGRDFDGEWRNLEVSF